jgi:hypothetical protein
MYWKRLTTWLTTPVANKIAAIPPVVLLDSMVNFEVSAQMLLGDVLGISFLLK